MVNYTDSERLENDMEHGYQLSLLCRLVMDELKLSLNKEKVLKYALAHDLIEVYSGDTNPFDPEAVRSKPQREHDALQRLEQEFWQTTDMFHSIYHYHDKIDDEAKFVYALDKLIPSYNIILGAGKTYKDFSIKREELIIHIHKAYVYEPLKPMADALIEELYKHDEWF